MKKLIALMLCIALIVSFVGCSSNDTEGNNGTSQETDGKQNDVSKEASGDVVLSMWSFTDELKGPIEKFEEQNPGIKIELTVIPNEDYPTKLKPVLASGKGAPDIYTGELAHLKQWIDTGYWENLSEAPYNIEEQAANFVPYVYDLGKDSQGNVRALSWQATPGGFFYRRSLAKEYLGTDDPAEVGAMMSSLDDFVELGRTLKAKSNGEVKLVTGVNDITWFYLGTRENGWVNENNEFVIDQKIIDYLEHAKILREEELEGKIDTWTPSWFEAMNTDNVFGYVLPTWGLHYVLKPNASETFGDWALASPPISYFWGGTWLGIYSKSEHKDEAWKFIKMMTTDEEFLTQYAKDTGDFMSNLNVVNSIKDDFSEEFLGGQNHYDFWSSEVSKIDASSIGVYDLQINSFLANATTEYIEGNVDLEGAIQLIKDDVKSAFPEITVK